MRRLSRLLFVSCAVTLLSTPRSTSATTVQDPYALPRTAVFSLQSPRTGSYRIMVALPAAYESSKDSFPIVYLLDGDWYFSLAASSSRLLEAVGEQRPSILVGVGYGGTVQEQRQRRIREFTPAAEATLQDSGRGAEFLAALQNDLVPAIESRYRVSTERVLVGHSLGGLFAAYAMTRAPGFFRHLVIGSPAFWASSDAMLSDVAELLKKGNQGPARMFLGVSPADSDPIRASHVQLVRTLTAHAPASLAWSAAEFAKSTHQSSVTPLISSGLPWVLPVK